MRHVRMVVLLALLAAVALGLLLPNPWKPQKQLQASQVRTVSIR